MNAILHSKDQKFQCLIKLKLAYLCIKVLAMTDGRKREHIREGQLVEIVQKHHQRSGELTEGFVKRILTNAKFHPHGIKVMLSTKEVGRVKNIIEDE